VVEHDDPERFRLRCAEPGDRSLEIASTYSPSLVAPGGHRAQPHYLEAGTGVDGIHAPVTLECPESAQHPGRGQHRDVVIPWDDQERRPEGAQVRRRRLVLAWATAMREVSARNDEVRRDTLDKLADRLLERRVVEAVPRAEMQVGHVEDAR
jgi:hypothetical protein